MFRPPVDEALAHCVEQPLRGLGSHPGPDEELRAKGEGEDLPFDQGASSDGQSHGPGARGTFLPAEAGAGIESHGPVEPRWPENAAYQKQYSASLNEALEGNISWEETRLQQSQSSDFPTQQDRFFVKNREGYSSLRLQDHYVPEEARTLAEDARRPSKTFETVDECCGYLTDITCSLAEGFGERE